MQVRGKSTTRIITLNVTGELGSGGEARVFPVYGTDKVVAKIYHHPDLKHVRKLDAMLSNPPEDPAKASGRISIAWPVEILCTPNGNHDFLGFLMPRVTGLQPLMGVYNPQSRKKFCPLFTYAYLLRAARNLASAVSALHTANCVLGDINESNTLVSSDALITMVDTDSFQIRDSRTGETYRCPVGKGEFTPPELQGEKFTDVYRKAEHDLFGLGVLIFQLLMEGTHPFSGVPLKDDDSQQLETRIKNGHFPHGSRKVPYREMPAAPPFTILSPELQGLFVQCFEEGHIDPQKRPDARTWHSSLDKAEAQLATCSVNRQHVYSNHLASCPWCERKRLLRGRDPFPSDVDVKAGRHLNAPPPKPATLKGPSPTPTPVKPPPVWPSTPSKRSGQNPVSRTAGCLIWFLVIGAISTAQKNCSQ
jgi:DNA-binding helix-hairpin-helix protein with protein kinase domain